MLNKKYIFIYYYQFIKLKKNFLTNKSFPHFTCYTLPHFQQKGPSCPALARDNFTMAPHFPQLFCSMETPFLSFRVKRVVNREKKKNLISQFITFLFFICISSKKTERKNSTNYACMMLPSKAKKGSCQPSCTKSYQTKLVSQVLTVSYNCQQLFRNINISKIHLL